MPDKKITDRNDPHRYRTNSGFVMREIAGEILLVPVGEQTRILNGMVTFTETGAFLWKHIDGKRDAVQLAELLAAECGETLERVLPDVERFLERAHAAGLLIE